MTAKNGNSPDVIGKLFLVRRHGLRECMVCGGLFDRAHCACARRGELLPGCRVLFA